ncbi:MAG: tRNA (uridine(34)/cytosine(34)/5-carboxymethylaminomethyluridine(34)-2'-O)-methyltransferase TrmL [Proteobacteria bacterium]|nr:tRNA (uridine(34)/cytosine(34)/5-carboxymethylaminomethyluridine(34)-2'-O)-methyltransferase TrmL [Pseudomonadota bacterium]MCH9048133.1 tRNA (uridine(34)/cytosine(34)/5-carboxymethylaminomethyluridine(34)-2'-O)-methyltransferase TrmL [Pseudomonadota bacterium]
MIHVVLYEPEIPPNTGNIIRLCANTGAQLHLIHPLGFKLDDARLLRAGLDYHEWADVYEHNSLNAFIGTIKPEKLYAISTRGKTLYAEADYPDDVALLFGPETRGLPSALLDELPDGDILRLPMLPDSRSLNLSNAAAILVYEVWKQNNFQAY